jgi:hypothetical protein
MDQTAVASIADEFGHLDDHSDAGPFDLLITQAAIRGALKTLNGVGWPVGQIAAKLYRDLPLWGDAE